MTDQQAMARAIELSKGGYPAPNPHVGCVIVREGQIVAEGFHDHAGGPHAEVVALEQAGMLARGATAYVTLEPCNHHGRTPPCSEALIAAGVSRVVIANPDPYPRAMGGSEKLAANGIKVEVGCLGDEARAANEQFFFALEHKRPLVVLKVAMSLDGRIALPGGESQWITGELARLEGHRLRAELGAVLVGRTTVIKDDPLLTARIPGVVNQPARIVLDPKGQLGGHEKMFGPEAPSWRVVGDGVENGDLQVPYADVELDLQFLLEELYRRQITGVLVEGGSKTVGHFIKRNLFDRLVLFVGPKLLGQGTSWLDQHLASTLSAVPQLRIEEVRTIGKDLMLVLTNASGTFF